MPTVKLLCVGAFRQFNLMKPLDARLLALQIKTNPSCEFLESFLSIFIPHFIMFQQKAHE